MRLLAEAPLRPGGLVCGDRSSANSIRPPMDERGSSAALTHLLATLDRGGWLTLHFGMSGALQFVNKPAAAPRFTRVRLLWTAISRAAANLEDLEG